MWPYVVKNLGDRNAPTSSSPPAATCLSLYSQRGSHPQSARLDTTAHLSVRLYKYVLAWGMHLRTCACILRVHESVCAGAHLRLCVRACACVYAVGSCFRACLCACVCMPCLHGPSVIVHSSPMSHCLNVLHSLCACASFLCTCATFPVCARFIPCARVQHSLCVRAPFPVHMCIQVHTRCPTALCAWLCCICPALPPCVDLRARVCVCVSPPCCHACVCVCVCACFPLLPCVCLFDTCTCPALPHAGWQLPCPALRWLPHLPRLLHLHTLCRAQAPGHVRASARLLPRHCGQRRACG